MKHRILGKTGLKVSEIGLGAAQIGGAAVSDVRAEAVLNRALDLGITFIDTAAMYGESEARIGKFISHRRDEFTLATKCGDYVGEVDGKRPISNAVWQRTQRPEGGFMGGPWERAQQFPLEQLAEEMPLVEFALRFTLSHPDVCTAIVGTTDPDHIAANVKISDGQLLPEEIRQRAKEAFREIYGTS